MSTVNTDWSFDEWKEAWGVSTLDAQLEGLLHRGLPKSLAQNRRVSEIDIRMVGFYLDVVLQVNTFPSICHMPNVYVHKHVIRAKAFCMLVDNLLKTRGDNGVTTIRKYFNFKSISSRIMSMLVKAPWQFVEQLPKHRVAIIHVFLENIFLLSLEPLAGGEPVHALRPEEIVAALHAMNMLSIIPTTYRRRGAVPSEGLLLELHELALSSEDGVALRKECDNRYGEMQLSESGGFLTIEDAELLGSPAALVLHELQTLRRWMMSPQ